MADKIQVWLALGVSIAVLAAACGGPEQSANNSASDAGEDQLVVLSDDVPASLNPDGPEAASPATIAGIGNLHDTLIGYPTSLQDGVFIPDYTTFEGRLAESWEVSEDGLNWTFTLREDVVSCAGNPLTADDVLWTFQRAKSVSGATPIAWFLANAGGVLPLDPVLPDATDEDKALQDTEVAKIDDRTVVFTLQGPNALFPRVLTVFGLVIYDSVEMEGQATEQDPWAHEFANAGGAAGFGAYCIDSWEQGQEMTLTANSEYYRGQPQHTSVVWRKVSETGNRVAAIRSGDADLVTNLAPREFESLAEEEGVNVLGWFSNETVNLILNEQYDLWQGKDGRLLRQAIAYAIPYDAVIEAIFPADGARRWYGMAPSDVIGFEEVREYETDLNRARELLEEAGYPEGRGLEAESEALTLYYVVERRSWLEPLAVQIQTALAEVGIPIQLEPITQAEAATRALVRKDLPMAVLDWLYPYVPDAGYHVQLFFLPAELGGVNNVMNYDSEEVTAAWMQATGLPEGDERNEALAVAQRQAMMDLPWVPLMERRTQVAVADGITGFEGRPDNILTFWPLMRD